MVSKVTLLQFKRKDMFKIPAPATLPSFLMVTDNNLMGKDLEGVMVSFICQLLSFCEGIFKNEIKI